MGVELGRETRAKGAHFLLAPGVNIYRSPLCARNFEYFGEDPLLAARMAVGTADIAELMLGGYLQMERWFWVPVALAVCVFLQIPAVYSAWAGSMWWWSRRLHYTLLLAANAAFVWWCWYWHLLPDVITGAG